MSLSRGEATPAAVERGLDEARAVDPLRRPAAPEIRRLEKALGDRDVIRFAPAGLREMARPEIEPVRRDREIAFPAHDRQPRAERERHARRQLDAGAGIGVRAQRGDPMGRLGRRPERRARQIADIMVAIELHPGPALALVVDRHALAVERFGLQRRVRVGVTPERRACRDNPLRLPVRVSRRVDETAQMIRREVGAGGGQATVERGGEAWA